MFWKLYGIRIAEEDEFNNFNKNKKSVIRVGNAFQAEVPAEALSHVDAGLIKDDTLLWKPSVLSEDSTKQYLQSFGCRDASDEEKALWLLHQCNYNTQEALRRHNLNHRFTQLDSSWTEFERSCFEKGMQKYGKNFHSIQKLLRSKSVEEIVDFYYEWKVKKMRHAPMNGHSLANKP